MYKKLFVSFIAICMTMGVWAQTHTLSIASANQTAGSVSVGNLPAGISPNPTAAGLYNVDHGTIVPIIASANAGYHFVQWQEADSVYSRSADTTVTVTSDRSFTAVFAQDTHAYVNMGDGLLWATCNVGADNPWDTGGYFAWGETYTKDTYNWSTYSFSRNGSSTNFTRYTGSDYSTLIPEDDAATVNWGGEWRMPTDEEWTALRNTTNYSWVWQTNYNGTGAEGMLVTRLTGPCAGNSIFLPKAGAMNPNGFLSGGLYWSSTIVQGNRDRAWSIAFSNIDVQRSTRYRMYGKSVRAVRPAPPYSVAANASDTTMGSVTGSGSYTHGTTATLTATPAPCHHLVSWSNGLTDDTITITVESDTAVTAIFERDAAHRGSVQVAACDSFSWYGDTYTSTPVTHLPTHDLQTADGCDSTVSLYLTINNSSVIDTTVAAINSFAWNGETYTASGDYTDSLTSVAGCDSTVTLHLSITYLDTITLAVNDTSMGSIALLGAFIPRDTVDLSTIHSNYTVQDGTVLTGTLGGNHKISVAAGASVMLKGVTINRIEQNNSNPRPGQGGNQNTPTYLWAGLSLMGDATIVLEDSNYVKGFNSKYPGIYVPTGSTLTIRGEGILTASPGEKTSSPYFEASAIGGGYQLSNGNIVIESGTIHAHGNYAAGIGGGYSGNPPKICGNITIRGGNIDASSIGCGDSETIDSITITGGIVIATGNDFEAGVGSGNFGTVNHIVITGGTVIANGGYRASGIGGGGSGHCGEVVIDSTVTLVTSTGGRDCPNHIGAGTWSTVDTVIVAGQGYTNINTPFSYTGNGTNDNFTQPLVFAIDSNSYIVQRGKRVVVQATPKPDYHLAEWSDSAAVNAAGTDTLTVNGSMLLTAIFAHDPYYIGVAVMDTSMGSAMVVYNDSVASRLPVEPDSVCTISATPKFGYHFVRWEEADSLYSRSADTSVTATSNRFFYALFARTYDTITLAVNDSSMGSIAIEGTFSPTDTLDLSTIQGDTTVQDGTVLTGTLGGIYKISVAAGASVMLSNMNITGVHDNNYTWAGLNLLGDATIVINDNTTNYIRGFHQHYPGIHVPVGATLTLRGNGQLTASAGNDPNQSYPMRAAGIGGGYNVPSGSIVIESGTINTIGAYGASLGGGYNNQPTACGNIAIHGGTVSASSIGSGSNGVIDTILITGGTVTASAYSSQAGIGCDAFGTVNNIIITGGTVNVTGGPYAAGIGGGNYATVNHITITGGTITATGGNNGAGIGSGPGRSNEGVCGDITIAGSVTSVTAIKGNGNTQNIGSGSDATCGTITVGGQPYSDNPNASSYTFVGDGSATQDISTQPTIIGIGGNSYRIARGTTVHFSAIPGNIYYRLANWTEADTVYSRTADTAATITSNRTLTAVFESNLQHITVNSSEGGNGHVAAACENFDSYTVGNHVAAEAIAHGNNSWTTWYRAPGTDADGTIANINGSNCAHFVRGNDQVMLFGDIADGVYDLEFDLMVPNGKDGYFNVLHHFDGSNSYRAIETYLHLYREYNLTKTPTPGFGDVCAGQEHAAVMPCVYDTWVHFRVHVDFDDDSAQLYYSLPGASDTLIHSWQWSLDASGRNTYYNHLSAIDFYPAHSDSTSEFYVDNIVLNRSNNNYPRGTQCNLTATPDQHHHFVCWMEADTVYSRSADTVIYVTGDRTFTALFTIDQHSISTACNDTSMGSTSVAVVGAPSQGNTSFAVADYGTTATISASPKFGYHFVRWEEAGSLYSRAADTSVTVTADRFFNAVFQRIYDTLTLAVNDSSMGSISLVQVFTPVDTVNLDTIQGDYTVPDGSVLTGTLGGNYKISVAAGASIMLSNMNITGVHDSSYMWAGLSLLGDATIVLDDSTTNYIKGFFFKYPGIHVPAGATLTLRGNGQLTAHSGRNGSLLYAAGIGGGYDVPSGNIVIESGTITTIGGYGASLGGGYNTQRRACGNIAIHGGTISATCIGGGYNALIDSVLITGGTITARASVNQPGIGCDGSGILNHLIISGGTVNATGGPYGAGIGGGRTATVNHITITGGTITATGGNLAAGIGSGSFYGHCGDITIATSVTSVTAFKGSGSTQNHNIGSGESGTCDTVIVGGQPYTDDPNASSYTFVGDGSTPSSNIPQPSVVAIGDNIYRIARGTSVVVQATPNPGYHLASWSDGAAVNAAGTDTLVVVGPTSITANFAVDPYSIGVAVMDTTSGSAVVIYNDSVATSLLVEPDTNAVVTILATPKYGYHFDRWEEVDSLYNFTVYSHTADTDVSATGNRLFYAFFEPNQYRITVLTSDTTMGLATVSNNLQSPVPSVETTTEADYGTLVAITATPDSGYHFVYWLEADSVYSRSADTVVAVDGDRTLTAVFELDMADLVILSAQTSTVGNRLKISFSFANQGELDYTSPVGITAYLNEYGGEIITGGGFMQFQGPIEAGMADTVNPAYIFASKIPCAFGPDDSIVLVVNDMGNGIGHLEGAQPERDTTNNIAVLHIGNLFPQRHAYGTDVVSVCDSLLWIDGNTYTASTDSASYTVVSGYNGRCDSIVTLNLTIRHSNTGDTAAVACDKFSWYEHMDLADDSDSLTHTLRGANAQGCDSTVTLHLAIRHSSGSDTTAVACDSMSWFGTTYTSTPVTNLPTHIFYGGNAQGCDSTITLRLTVNHSNTGDTTAVACDVFGWYEHQALIAGSDTLTHLFPAANQWGCDSTVTLHLTVNYKNTGDTTAVACDQFSWYEHQALSASSDTLFHIFDGANQWGCDSTVTLHLTVNYKNTGDTTAVACDSFSWYEHQNITASNETLTHLFAAANQGGCDSTVTLHLTVNYQNTGDTTAVACDRFYWYEHQRIGASTDTLTHLLPAANQWGCDSTVTLHLTVNYQSSGDTTAVVCDSFSWYEYQDVTLSNDKLMHLFPAANQWGCDSTVTLHLTVNYSNTGDTTAVECDHFNWYGTEYTANAEPTHVLTNVSGCDSTLTLHLTVNYQNTEDTSVTVCDQYIWYGTTYTLSGEPTRLYPAANQWGCDSTLILHLTVNHQSSGDTTAVVCDQFSWYEHLNITASNTISHLFVGGNQWGCDSTVTLHLTVNYQNTGDTTAMACDKYNWYEHQNLRASVDTLTHLFKDGNRWGCDSTVTLHLTVNYENTGDTTAVACDQFNWYEHHNLTASCNNLMHTFVAGNSGGCDSTVTLHLTVNYQNTGDTLAVECDQFSWYEHQNITASCIRTHNFVGGNRWGCDSTVTLHLTVNYQNSGDTSAVTYQPFTWYEHLNMDVTQDVQHLFAGGNRWGCDSTVTLHLRYALFSTSWTGDTVVTYNSLPQTGIAATYVDDTGRTQQVALTFTKGNEVITSPNYPVSAGVWNVTARPLLPVDSLSGSSLTLTILPATVYVSGATARTAKVADGTTVVEVTDQGTLNNIQGDDPLTHVTTANFDNPSVGDGKTITLTYTLQGPAALVSNYQLQRTTEVYSNNGTIIEPILPTQEQAFDVAQYGYCTGSASFGYHLSSGAPDQYKIDYADDRFADVDWTDLATTGHDGTIDFLIPDDMPTGDYALTITFRDSRFPWLESNPISTVIHVNLPASYTMPLFYNVIILIDTCECFTDVQWYHRDPGGQWQAIPGANDYNYHEATKLSGEYFVSVTMTQPDGSSLHTYTCPQTDVTTLVRDPEPATVSLKAHPNPASDNVTLSLTNSDDQSATHILRVVNTVGVEMEHRTFKGSDTTLDISAWQRGSYIVSVDGIIVRIIKK